jgi:hypothetical protein
MSDSDRIFLKLIGKFAWPPVSPGRTAELEAEGTVVIRYREKGSGLSAYVSWIPKGHGEQGTPSEDDAAYDVASLKAQSPDKPFSLWTQKLPTAFKFRGGQLFEKGWSVGDASQVPDTAVALRSDPPGSNATASHLLVEGTVLIAELALPRFGKRAANDSTALLAKVSIPHHQTKVQLEKLRSAAIPETRFDDQQADKQQAFVRGQAAEVLKAIGVTPTDSGGVMTVGATIKGHGIVYRFYNVPANFFPEIDGGKDKTRGLICFKRNRSHKHAIIAHTSSRELWIDTGHFPKLTLEARVAWPDIDSKVIFTGSNRPTHRQQSLQLKPTIDLAVTWHDQRELTSPFANELPCVTIWQVLDASMKDAGLGIEALKSVAGGQPQTFLPSMHLSPGLHRFAAYHRDSVQAKQQIGGGIEINLESRDRAMRFTIAEEAEKAGEQVEINGTIAWPIFSSSESSIKLLHAEPVDAIDDPYRDSGEWLARFDVVATEDIAAASGRLGSLQLSKALQQKCVSVGRRPKEPFGHLLIRTPRTIPAAERNEEGSLVFRPQSEFSFRFPLSAVHPVATDIPWGDREIEATPLLVPLSNDPATSEAFLLIVTETLGPDTDRQLTAKILDVSAEAAHKDRDLANTSTKPVSYVLVATEPFGVVRFARQPLATSGDAESAIVAAFDSDSRTWLFRKVSEEYRYDFPPQGIGEGSDKPGRWELHDLAKDGPGKDDIIPEGPGPNSPAAVVRASPEGQASKSYVVDCRFSPSTTLWIRPSDLERNYFLPEWAAHEIFRQHNDLGIGAALSALRGEFLYGLAVGVSTRKETGPGRAARVAEVEALTGRLPAKKYTDKPNPQLARRWGSLRRALKTRHERLEVWTPAPGEPRPFGAARFQSGVTYALRLETASMRPPVPPPASAPDSEKRNSAFGLPGGALWPIESRIFYDAIRGNPQSSGGTIERIAIGPTGGDADLRAEFLGGTVAIVAEVRNGFVQRQRVEIIGRVGVLWHRAKHVVVYERTVNPSAQFAPEWEKNDDPGWSRYRSRRPIVRKVSEFVELIEPVRKYPDLGSTDPKSCGFLDSVRFNSKTINVDSAWAVDVQGDNNEGRGYALPLWNRGAALRRPQVYPEPDVAFVTIGEGKEERPLVAQGCLDTDNLWFYSEPTPGGNPDAWNDVFGVDWGHVLPPSVIDTEMTPGGDSHDGPQGGRKAPVPRTMPGYRRFTWRLARADAKTAVNAAYGAKPVFVGLDSVTFARRMPADVAKAPDSLKVFQRGSQLIAFASTLIEKLNAVGDANKLPQEIESFARKVTEGWDPLQLPKPKDLFATPFGCNDCASGCTQLQNRLTALIEAKARLVTQSARELIQDQLDRLRTNAEAIATDFPSRWEVVEKNSSLRTQIVKGLFTELTDANENPLGPLMPLRLQIEELVGAADSAHVALDNEIEKVKALLHGVLRECRVALEDLAERIDSVALSFTSTAVWSENRSKALIGQVNDQLKTLSIRLLAEVDEGKHRFAAELGPLAVSAINQVENLFGIVLEHIGGIVGEIKELIFNAHQSADWYLNEIKGRHDSIVRGIEKLPEVSASIDKKVGECLVGKGEADLGGILSLVDDALRTTAINILNEEVIAKAIVEQIPEELIASFVSVATSPTGLKEILVSAAEAVTAKLDAAVHEATDAASKMSLSDLSRLTEGVKGLCEKARDWWDGHLLPDEQELKIKALADAIKELKQNVDVQKWIGDNKKLLENSTSAWHSYSGVVSEKLMALRDGGIAAAPGNALRLLSAATTAPEIGVLQGNVDRVRCSYEEAKVKLTKAKASLNRLGDALKAMGIDVPFDGIGDTLTLPEAELSKLDVTKLFPSFGGLDLTKLLGDVKLPSGVKDSVRITHDFDRQQLRAWVQVDVDVPVPGKRELYAIGPFALYFRDSKLTGRMRAEASQEDDAVRDTGTGEIATNIDVVVNGELLLSLERVRITYSGTSGLKFDFDPQYIRLHPSMQFVQDTFGDLFADEIGGLTILKESGVPVGVEHLFSLPTISLMSGTTGIANIQLSNAFQLRAYSEFVIANRFNLSRVDAPFLFTFFILGGTGYTFVDTSYSPLTNKLAVTVEAAIGGAAALGFAWGPVNGSVYITLFVGLTYRKVIGGGKSVGDGLAVFVSLLIAGNVSLKGMVDISIAIMLRIIYCEGGRIDGLGTLAVKVKISRLITIKYNAQITYKLCNGRSTTATQSSTSTVLDDEQQKKLEQIQEYRKKLEKARS